MEPRAVSSCPMFASPSPQQGTGGAPCAPLYPCGCVPRCCPWKPQVTSSSSFPSPCEEQGRGGWVAGLLLVGAFACNPHGCLVREALSSPPFYSEENWGSGCRPSFVTQPLWGSLSPTLCLPGCECHHGLVQLGAECQGTSPRAVT